MVQFVVVVVVGAVAVLISWWLRRRGVDDPEQGATWTVPAQLDRADFDRPAAPWLVVVFSSTTCLACGATWDKARVLESDVVAVAEVEAVTDKARHDRYGIDAVPTVVVADAEGVVQWSFVGEPTAADLWAALAELRS